MIYEPLPSYCLNCRDDGYEVPTHQGAACKTCFEKSWECPECAGEGAFTRWKRHDYWGAVDSDVKCRECDGTGKKEGWGDIPPTPQLPSPAPTTTTRRRVTWVSIEEALPGTYTILVSRQGQQRRYRTQEISRDSQRRLKEVITRYMQPDVEMEDDLTMTVRFYRPEVW